MVRTQKIVCWLSPNHRLNEFAWNLGYRNLKIVFNEFETSEPWLDTRAS